MDGVENFEQLLDYVYTDEDVSDTPSIKEYKQLGRVMQVMVRFYVRGEAAKKAQYEKVLVEIEKIDANLKMSHQQMESLQNFAAFHPKRKEYEETIEQENEELNKVRAKYQEQADSFHALHEWGLKIVDTMKWLEGNLKHYANQKLKTEFDTQPIVLTPEKYIIYKAGLAEVTYNLQESQDFFDASLDGRLQLYHEMERDMIKAQLEAISGFPEDSPRRQHYESELNADLEYVIENMKDNPKVRRHRELMQRMHKDFFALLKWQRKKMLSILGSEPEKIDGDVEKLKKDLEDLEKKNEKDFSSKYDVKDGEGEGDGKGKDVGGCPVGGSSGNGVCPVGGSGGNGVCPVGGSSGGVCPVGGAVDHSAMAKAFTHMTVEEKKEQGFIHKLYEEDGKQ